MQSIKGFIRSRPWLKAALLPGVRFARRAIGAIYRRTDIRVPSGAVSYAEWLRRHGELTEQDCTRIAAHMAAMPHRPLISVVMPVFNTDPRFLSEAIGSVQAQIWPEWELCIADDASTDMRIPALLAAAAAKDPRIHWVRRKANGHIAAASNDALGLARGEWAALLDHDDRLAPDALYQIAAAVEANPAAQVIYSDEDKIDARGTRQDPHFKPDLDPDLLLSQNMVSHLGAYRIDLLRRIGGFRLGLDGSQDHDLVLRCLAECGPDRIVHIPSVLYHWRQTAGQSSFSQGALDRCAAASRQAVQDHLAQCGIAGDVVPAPLEPAYNRVVYPLPDPAPLVSIIVPTRDRVDLLDACLQGVLARTDYPMIEVIVVDNDSAELATIALFDRLRADRRVRILPVGGPFNFPALNNAAAMAARGEVLLLLNNDTLVIEPGWLREMISHAMRPGVGAVGAKLLYADRTIQHAGVVLGVGSGPNTVAGHYGLGAKENEAGVFGRLAVTRSVAAVTAACLAVQRVHYLAAGGMDAENLSVAFNDVDFCLKLRTLGLRNVITPHARMIHLESTSRGYEDTPEKQARFAQEIGFMRRKWGTMLDHDPYWNPNLSLIEPSHGIAPNPRRPRLPAGALLHG